MILALVLKAFAISIVGLATVRLAHRTRASVRHGILVAMFVAIALLPLLSSASPPFEVTLPMDTIANPKRLAFRQIASQNDGRAPSPEHQASSDIQGLPEGQALRPGDQSAAALPIAWLAGVMLFLTSLVIGIVRVQQLRRTALPASTIGVTFNGTRPGVDLLSHEALTAPIAVGIVRPAIILPRDAHEWDARGLHRAIVHELEHIRRHDWLTQLFARLVCALFWFNPLIWMAYRRLTLNAEYACDDAVVVHGTANEHRTTMAEEGTVYADQLVSLARRMNTRAQVAMLGMAQRSDLAARVHAVLDASKVRGRAGAGRAALIALASAAVLMTIAPLRIVAAPLRETVTIGDAAQRPSRASWRDRALLEAIDSGDIQDVRELLDDGANVNASVDGDGSPLIVAAREGHIAIVRLLLERGADVNLAVSGDGAPLIMAAREGHVAIVTLLLDHGANIELMVPDDENALIQASGAGEIEVVKLLVARGANVNARAMADVPVNVRSWTDRGARVTHETRQQLRTPLNQAIRGGHLAVAEFLRGAGAVE